ncbi:MAG: DUF1127 domain-containing protein [Proteobacteria bacterium]|nr:DUF1127 domain-containing protein [Pseudomonadota bacterium]
MKLRSILTTLRLWHRRYRTRRQMLDLSPHLLHDIGIDDAARTRECVKWLWQGIPDDEAGAAANKNARGIAARVPQFEN